MAQADFVVNVQRVQEKSRQKDKELEGGWYTEERMTRELKYSTFLGLIMRAGMQFCCPGSSLERSSSTACASSLS